ncbi:hypothetical protein JCM11641_007242 [Rhodosporidiobolus odoratus]
MIYTSPFPSITPEEQHKGGVFDFLYSPQRLEAKKDKTALVDGLTGRKVTHGELASASLRLADGLTRIAGLKCGQTFLIFSPNSLLYPVLIMGGQAAGLCVSTANAGYTSSELAHQLELSDSVLIFAATELLRTAEKAAKEAGLPLDKVYVLPDAKGDLPEKLPAGMKSWKTLDGKDGFKAVVPTPEKARTKPAYLPFSSGTTGKAKGVALSAHNITTCILQLALTPGLFDRPDVLLSALPMSHIFGIVPMLHTTLHNNGTLVILPKFELQPALEAIQKYKCTTALIVPPIALGLSKHPMVEQYDLSSLRYILSGAAPLSADLERSLASRVPSAQIIQGLGMTEVSSVATIPNLDSRKSGSTGRVISSMEARLVDPEGRDVKEGEAGELWVRGPNVMLGYYKNEKATRETVTEDGWMKTGDICQRDRDGYFYVVDRSKDLIKYKGFQVAPAELEGVLISAPFVADAAVIGVYSEENATELPRAYVVPDAKHLNSKTLVADVKKWVENKLAPHKRLRGGVIIVDSIPKSPSGKILRKDLRVLAAKETKTKARL